MSAALCFGGPERYRETVREMHQNSSLSEDLPHSVPVFIKWFR